ncbi:MAG: response regulator [Armatimonadetes bacterium]|nr:response regulator [Armatimonadota bacterium]
MAKILVVDDEPHVVELVAFNLRREGYTVVSAENGAAALLAVDREHPDLIVLDILMPIMDGVQVARTLKANPETREIPILFLTAKAQDADILEGLTAGAEVYLPKPFSPIDLLRVVTTLLAEVGEGED